MNALARLSPFALVAFAAACSQPAEQAEAPPAETRTVVETREVAVPQTVVVETPTPPAVVVERDRRGDDSTTVRAGRDGIEVETTNR